jgi:hypothetical protein
MSVVEAASEIGLEDDLLDPGCPLLRPAQNPGCVQPSIRCAPYPRLGDLPGNASVRLDAPMLKRLKRISQAEDRAVNWIIKKAIEQYVERWDARDKKK